MFTAVKYKASDKKMTTAAEQGAEIRKDRIRDVKTCFFAFEIFGH